MKYLYTPTVKRTGVPVLVDSDQLVGRQGFRSVFGYPETTTLTIQKQANTRDITHLPVYCDTLFVDFDDQIELANKFEHYLREEQYEFSKYDSGNRSVHFHVPVVPIVGNWVPRAVYEYASKHANGCDLSIYRHTGLFRLVGTWHEKHPGHFKRLLATSSGRSLVIEQPRGQTLTYARQDLGVPLSLIINKRVDTGGRRCYAYTIGNVCNKRGLSQEDALRLALQWNDTCAVPPLEPEIIWQKIEEAYR